MLVPAFQDHAALQKEVTAHMADAEKHYKRLYPRRKVSVSCQLTWDEKQTFGNAMDVSLGGLTVMLHRSVEPSREAVMIRIPEGEGIVLRARPVHRHTKAKGTLVGFEIEQIENGKQEWQHLCYIPSW